MIIKDNKQPPVINLDKSARFLVVEKKCKNVHPENVEAYVGKFVEVERLLRVY